MGGRTVKVSILGDATGLSRAFGTAQASAGKFSRGISSTLLKVAGPAALAGIAVGVVKLGSTFDSAFDTIRRGTGKTGETLEGLEDSFKDVFTSVPTSAGDASKAIADLNTRTGLTGDALEELARQELELARITETELGTVIDKTTRMFGDWGVETGDQTELLDRLFRASQETGIGIDELAESTVRYGAPLRNLGFSIDDSIALFAKWNKEGVNTEAIFSGLKIAVGKFADSGQDVPEAFAATIQAIEDAESASEATGIAIDVFGQRAGPDLADAIRGGKFELADLLDVITNGEDTIAKAAADTESFGEKWTMLKNKVLTKLEPIATRVFDAMGNAMDAVAPHIDSLVEAGKRIGEWIQSLRDNFDRFKPVLAGVAAAIGTVLVGAFLSWAAAAAAAAAATLAATWPILAIAAAVAAVVAGFVYAYQHFETFRNIVDTVVAAAAQAFEWLVDNAGPAWEAIVGFVTTAIDKLSAMVAPALADLAAFWKAHGEDILTFVSAAWDAISTYIGAVIRIIQGIIQTTMALIDGDWGKAWDGIKKIASGVWDAIKAIIKAALAALKLLFILALAAIKAVWNQLWNSLKSSAATAWKSFTSWIEGVWETFKGWWSDAWTGLGNTVANVFTGLLGPLKAALNGILRMLERGINVAISGINTSIRGLNIVNPFSDVPYVSKVSLPQLAGGGTITRSGLAIVGEQGPEIVALNRGAQVIPNRQAFGSAAQSDPLLSAVLELTRAIDAFARQPIAQVALNVDGDAVAQTLLPSMTEAIRLRVGSGR